MYGSRKYLYASHEESLEIPRGWGFQKVKHYFKTMCEGVREDSNQKKPPWEGYGKDKKRQEPLIRRQEVRVKEMRNGKFRHPIPPTS